ncbi:MAG: HAMP domain-containing protein [Chloroflexi bacterium]|nr:HAMP domain-containing protein [Chloroflexota bacterium]
MSIRARLTVWYTAVLAALIVLLGAGVYAILAFSLTRQIDQTLSQTAEEVLRASRVRIVQDVRVLAIPELDVFRASAVYVQVWDLDNHLVSQSRNLGTFGQSLDGAGLGQEAQVTHEVTLAGAHVRVLTVPIRVEDKTVGYLQVGASLRTVDDARALLLVILVGGAVVAIGLAALIGAFLASRALAPIDQVTQLALQITRADDLSRRIDLPGPPNDEIVRLSAAFNESLERLERLFNAQRRFVADVSHELRTPLTAILGNVDLLRRIGADDRDSLDAIQSEAERMSRLVGDLLLLAQAEAGTLPVAREPVELDTLLLEVYRQMRVLALDGGIEMQIAEEDQARVLGDRDRLKQLLINLLSNALKYTPQGGRVTLGLARVNNWARLTVSDTGPGIPAEDLSRIFERFYRVDKARNRAQGGAGLGLAIAQRIARMHGGRIEVASEGVPGRGSTFSVWLPLASN